MHVEKNVDVLTREAIGWREERKDRARERETKDFIASIFGGDGLERAPLDLEIFLFSFKLFLTLKT